MMLNRRNFIIWSLGSLGTLAKSVSGWRFSAVIASHPPIYSIPKCACETWKEYVSDTDDWLGDFFTHGEQELARRKAEHPEIWARYG
jgi:hypothetical protein